MKKRLLSLVLAASMIFGSINVAFADETSVSVDATTEVTDVAEDTVALADTVESGSSVDNSDNTQYGINWTTTSPWMATVYGDAGGQNKMNFYGNKSDTWTLPDGTIVSSEFVKVDGEVVFPYDVQENGSTVNMRMGVFNADGTVNQSVGKIGGNKQDGRVYYYQKLTSSDDFTLSAKAHINNIDNTNSQVSFGLVVTDGITPGLNEKVGYESISAGYLRLNDASAGKMYYAFPRVEGAVPTGGDQSYDELKSSLSESPKAGDDVELKIVKSGKNYTITVGEDTSTFDGSELKMEDDIFAGLYVARNADITFSNVKLQIAGAPIEVGDWESGGNGFVGNADKIGYVKATANEDNTNIKFTLDTESNGEGLGKMSSSEDSFGYYAMKAPVGEDFKVSATIDYMNLFKNKDSSEITLKSPQQGAVGFTIFNNKYTRDGNNGSIKKSYGNNVFIGINTAKETSTNYQLVARVRRSASDVKTTVLMTGGIGDLGQNTKSVKFKVIKSGDNLKVTYGDKTFDVNIKDVFTDAMYIGYMVSRDGEISVSNNYVTVGAKKVQSLELLTSPEKTSYYSTEAFDATGLTLKATYTDGTTGIIDDPDDYTLSGFDDLKNKLFIEPGERTLTVSAGEGSIEIPINVRAKKVISLNVDYAPIYDTFYEGGKLNNVGLQVTAKFEDGSSQKLTADQMDLHIGDTLIEPNKTVLTLDMVGEAVPVVVTYTSKDNTIDNNGCIGTFDVKITAGKLIGIKIYTVDYKTTYYLDQKYDPTGFTVQGVYLDSNGDRHYQILSSDQYEVLGFDSSKIVDSLPIRVQYKDDPSLYATYNIKVIEALPVKVDFVSYPRLTFDQGEAFDATGLDLSILYTNDENISLCKDAFFYKNKTEYYKIYNNDIKDEDGKVIFTKGQRVDLTEAEVFAADFYIDITDYNNEKLGVTAITFNVNEKYGSNCSVPITWNITIKEATDYVWKASLFGASSLGVLAQDTQGPSSYINVNYKDGSSAKSNDISHDVKPELMENGKLDNVESVDVTSWSQAGKISGDQDGIAYYYTKVNGHNNFSLSADIRVNRYMIDPADMDAEQTANYNRYLSEGCTHKEALDRMRTGQEAFGIMARDVIPFTPGVDENGEYLGDATDSRTQFASNAVKVPYTFTKADGSTVTIETPADIYEGYKNKIKVTDNTGAVHEVTKQNVENTFASNIVIAGGCTDGTYPTDPNSSSYVKKTLMNRINIMTRRGVIAPKGTGAGGKRVGIYSTTNDIPVEGDVYNITLTKLNTGYMITTYDYQTGDTVTKYSFEVEDDTENVLEIQDADNIYVGFFAARWADCTVSNIKLHETSTATDPNISVTVNEAVSPKVTVSSPYYTTTTNYGLRLKSNSTKGLTGGVTNISVNGKNVYEDVILGNKASTFNVELKPDTINQFSVVYYPNTADNFLSYDPVITRFTVTHKTLNDIKKLYVGPAGSVNGDGTRDNPLNLDTAIALVGFGGEIIMLDGTYYITNTDLGMIDIPDTYSGYDNGNFKTLRAEEGANPVVDLENLYDGFEVDADYWHFKGISVTRSKENTKGMGIAGKHCVVENCTFFENGTTGFQVSRINSSDETIYDWPSYNVIKSCESYNNCDPSKNNADGFGSKLTVGFGNVFEDCVSHHNLDDGWDCYTKLSTGAIGSVTLENCITYRQGYQLLPDGSESDFGSESGGNGFKLGGENIYVPHYLKDCITFGNKGSGIDTNNNPGIVIRNVVAYNNGGYNISLYAGSGGPFTDSSGKLSDANNRPYKFNYDVKGAISAGRGVDRISSENDDVTNANVSDTPLKNETNFLNLCPKEVFYDKDDPNRLNKSDYLDNKSVNSEGVVLDENSFFKSTDPEVSYGKDKRYPRAEDGSFIHGDFLALTTPYEHEAEDIVTLPDIYGGNGGIGLGTNKPVETSTETTTRAYVGSSGAGGGGSVSQYKPKTTETTTVAENNTETTTETSILTASIKVTVNEKNISVNDKEFAMDVAPYIQADSNSTMVPLRFVAIAIAGGDVDSADSSEIITWDAVAKTATITAGSNSIVFTAGARTYAVNGNTLNISNQAVAEIVDGRMFVPFRTIGEALGADVSWDAATKTAMYN